MTTMTKVSYAYMRVFCDTTDQQVLAIEHRIHCFAEDQGFQLADIYHEFVSGSQGVFNDLVSEIKYSGAEVVIVPSLRHFSRNRVLQSLMLSRLEDCAGAEVITLRDAVSDTQEPQ